MVERVVVYDSVGMADPNALIMAASATYIFEKTGYPEGLEPLCEAIIYVCEAPKTNTVEIAMNAAKRDALIGSQPPSIKRIA